MSEHSKENEIRLQETIYGTSDTEDVSPAPAASASKYIPLKYRSADEQPREKLMEQGAESLTDEELIAILVSTGTKQRSAIDISNDLLETAGRDLITLHRNGWKEMEKVPGIGPAKAVTIYAAIELGYRMRNRTSKLDKISDSKDIVAIIRNDIEMLDHEELWLLFLNNCNKVIKKHRLSQGGLTSTLFDIRVAMKEAILADATGVIMAHNHPSGNINPSDQDKNITREMKRACGYMGMRLLDHVIIVGNGYFSFFDEGVLSSL